MMKAMIFAAGLGTRLKPLTDRIPKALVPVGGQPLIDRVIAKLVNAGATEIVVNVHHLADQLISHLQDHDWGAEIRISDEREALLNTGGGLRHAAPLFSPTPEPILIHNVDILSNVDLRALYAAHHNCDALLLVSQRKTQRYLLFDDENRLRGWTNIATGEVRSPYPNLDISGLRRLAFAGIHTFSPSLFERMASWPDNFSIIDFYLSICTDSRICCYEQPGLQLLDVGKVDTLHEAEHWLSLSEDRK